MHGKVVNASASISGCPGFKSCPSPCFLIDKELYSTVCLFTQVYKALRGNPAMDWHPVHGGEAIFSAMLHAKETRISSGHFGFWLVHAFAIYLYLVLK